MSGMKDPNDMAIMTENEPPTQGQSQPGPPCLIPLLARDGSVRAHAIVDAADFSWLSQWRWRVQNGTGTGDYAARAEGGRQARQNIFMHREILGLPHRSDGRHGDHINGKTLDNRRSNLRVATGSQNQQNRRVNQVPKASRFRGVGFSGLVKARPWRAYAQHNGRQKHLGHFASELEAAQAASEWRAAHMPFSPDARGEGVAA